MVQGGASGALAVSVIRTNFACTGMQIDSVPARARFTGTCVPRIQDRGKSAAEVVRLCLGIDGGRLHAIIIEDGSIED